MTDPCGLERVKTWMTEGSGEVAGEMSRATAGDWKRPEGAGERMLNKCVRNRKLNRFQQGARGITV